MTKFLCYSQLNFDGSIIERILPDSVDKNKGESLSLEWLASMNVTMYYFDGLTYFNGAYVSCRCKDINITRYKTKIRGFNYESFDSDNTALDDTLNRLIKEETVSDDECREEGLFKGIYIAGDEIGATRYFPCIKLIEQNDEGERIIFGQMLLSHLFDMEEMAKM